MDDLLTAFARLLHPWRVVVLKQKRPLTKLTGFASRTALWAVVFVLVSVGMTEAASLSFRTQADTDVLTLTFDGQVPDRAVRRVGEQQIRITLPGSEPLPQSQDFSGRLIRRVDAGQGAITIQLKSNAFGYISTPVSGSNALQVQIFRDPLGARWKGADVPPAATPAEAPTPVVPKPPATIPEPDAIAQPPAEEAVDGTITEPPASVGAEMEEVPLPSDSVLPTVAAPDGNLSLDAPRTTNGSLFSVPYAVRAQASEMAIDIGPSEVESIEPTGEVRYKAVNTFSEPETPDGTVTIDETSGAGSFGESPGADDDIPTMLENDTGPDVEVITESLPAAGEEPLADPPEAESITLPVDPQVEETAAVDAGMPQGAEQEADPLFYRFLNRGMRPQPAPESITAQVGDDEASLADTLPIPEGQSGDGGMAPIEETGGLQIDDAAVQQAIDTIEAGDATVSEVPLDPNSPEAQEAKRLEGLRLQVLKAQSQIATGKLKEAHSGLKSVLGQPGLPADMRLEALYSLGGVKMAIYRDEPEEYYDEITSLYKEAMNADLGSDNLPQALMNLGLINLWVGNIPEAQAYFDLLVQDYPDNENVSAIEYYWGEYYFRLEDWQEAADRFQSFIEKYPEQERLARQAAFHLAEALQKLGMYEQSYQIVDYIDKRWPQIFESSPGFLKMAGDIEFRLEMYDKAKDHYWTFYNINPKAEGADIVLARIGDVYLRQGERRGAGELYERAVEEFPDMEGGLVSKMRLAEEGIYDEPTMLDMVTVFDQPYSSKPKAVYAEIVDDYPDSPLAPLALLKLGMWHFFQKEYADALGAAQRLLDEYPRSPLTDRAKELGDRAFALAVPQLLEQENYQLVVDYWESYDFIDKSTGDEGNSTRVGVSQSYAALDEFENSLQLLEPFLGDSQVEEYSELALALALQVYLEQRAWSRIDDLTEQVEGKWDLSPRARRLLMHAKAVALENLGESKEAVRLWAQLGADEDVEDFIRADALYFMAKEAMKHQDLKRVFVYSQEALSMLLGNNGDEAKVKDCLLMSIYATERSGRYRQALKWAVEYDKYIPEDDPEWGATRYKLGEIYRKAGFEESWREIMTELRERQPDSLYGRLAASAIETQAIEERAMEYAPSSN